MAEKAVGGFGWFPLEMGWWLSVSQKWEAHYDRAVIRILCLMWQEGFQTLNQPKALAQAAGVTPKAWKAIQEGVGAFFTVKGEILTQEYLEGKYVAALGRSEKFRTRNSNNAKSGWGKRREKIQWRASGVANGTGNGNGNGDANGMPMAYPIATPMARDRASSSLFLDQRLEEEREDLKSEARAKIDAKDPRVLAVLNAYPTQGRGADGHMFPVHIGVRAAGDIADFMTENPQYPLLWVVTWYADREKRPKDLRSFLADPPAYAMWKNAWLKDDASLQFRLHGQSKDVLANAKGVPA